MRATLNTILAVTLIYSAPSVIAQTSQVLEEIVVTAQRREQSLQDVPISVSVLSGIEIETQNIKEAQDYLSLIPNVSFSEEGQRGERQFVASITFLFWKIAGEAVPLVITTMR